MPIETIQHDGHHYPAYQATGNAARFIMPFAKEVLKDMAVVYDIGCNRPEWSYPGSIMIDVNMDDPYDAHNLPPIQADGIFASHVIEHLHDWVGALDHWYTKLKKGGVLFLYWPAYSQSYWRPWSNRKHINIITPEMLKDYLIAKGYTKIFIGAEDLYNSHSLIAEKI